MEDLIEYSSEQQIIFAMLQTDRQTDRQTDLLHNVVIDNTSNRVHLESIAHQRIMISIPQFRYHSLDVSDLRLTSSLTFFAHDYY